jgi:hypothetical protein
MGVHMKFVIFALLLTTTTSLFAQSEKCFVITDAIDRKYCIDKYLQAVKAKLAAEKKTWAPGLSGAVKETKIETLQNEVQAKKDQVSLVNSEIALYDQHLVDLNAAKVNAAAPKKKEKKKEKKKLPFGIKL